MNNMKKLIKVMLIYSKLYKDNNIPNTILAKK